MELDRALRCKRRRLGGKVMSNDPQATVMVVDDEPRVGRLFERILSEEGYRVMTATSGQRALRLAEEAHPDVILLDIVMPGLDGLATLRALREQGHRGTVIVLTAQGTLQTAREAMTLDAYDYITKPFSLDFLKSVLRQGIEQKSAACAH
jgi:DNA-binding NtrC family response regulator